MNYLKYLPHLLLVVGVVLAGYKLYYLGYDAAKLEAANEAVEVRDRHIAQINQERKRSAQAGRRFNELEQRLQDNGSKIENEVRKIIDTVEFRCPIPADGLRLINQARSGRVSEASSESTEVLSDDGLTTVPRNSR